MGPSVLCQKFVVQDSWASFAVVRRFFLLLSEERELLARNSDSANFRFGTLVSTNLTWLERTQIDGLRVPEFSVAIVSVE